MDYENSLSMCIRKGDILGLESLGISEKCANEKMTCPTPVPSKRDEFFLPTINYPTPLVYAIQCKQMDSISYLLQHGAKVDQSPVMGWYPIHFAIASHSYEITELILSLYPDEINRKSENGATPLHFAVSSNNLRLVLLALKYGAKPNASDNTKSTPLHYSIRCHDEQILLALLAAGADLTAVDSKKQTPEIIAQNMKTPLLANVIEKLAKHEIEIPKLEDLYQSNEIF